MVTQSGEEEDTGSDYIPILTTCVQPTSPRSEGQRAKVSSHCCQESLGLQLQLDRPGHGYVTLGIMSLHLLSTL